MRAFKEQVRFLKEGLAQRFVEFGEDLRVGCGERQVAKIQPLAREVRDQRLRTWVGEHAPHLPLHRDGIVQVPLLGQGQ